jgi:hypothetical protein
VVLQVLQVLKVLKDRKEKLVLAEAAVEQILTLNMRQHGLLI